MIEYELDFLTNEDASNEDEMEGKSPKKQSVDGLTQRPEQHAELF